MKRSFLLSQSALIDAPKPGVRPFSAHKENVVLTAILSVSSRLI